MAVAIAVIVGGTAVLVGVMVGGTTVEVDIDVMVGGTTVDVIVGGTAVAVDGQAEAVKLNIVPGMMPGVAQVKLSV